MKTTNQINKGAKTMSKRKIFIAAIAICLVAILSMGTLAWFTDEDKVTNKFYVGDTTTDADEVFGIDLWETSDKNGDDTITDDETYGKDTKDDTGITYEDILPGGIYDKNPYFTNTGIHDQYLRAIVTVTEADILKAAMVPHGATHSEWYDVAKFLPGTSDKWTLEYKYYTNKDTFVFVYYYNEILGADETTEKLFDDVVIPTELTKEQAAEIDNFDITIVGQVIQSDNLADVTNAKEAFAKYWDEDGAIAGVKPEDLATDDDDTVSVSYPVTGTLGTIKSDLITYDPANYTDPEAPGALIVSGATATIKAGADFVTVPAEENNVTMIIMDTDFTVEDGAKLVDCPHSTGAIYVRNLTINGVKVTYANAAEMSAKYFSGLGVYFA